eukprot:TRINITY_DN6028_c0_g1_i1.p1 TRINITY_DN6028_c0_g1~~TRINITY_DN6028_c0_g1_i1.p1  ORF type:complete len:259 (-),score=47.21 TRINITY_DN6028_c0_g1_i1:386-1162(-)
MDYETSEVDQDLILEEEEDTGRIRSPPSQHPPDSRDATPDLRVEEGVSKPASQPALPPQFPFPFFSFPPMAMPWMEGDSWEKYKEFFSQMRPTEKSAKNEAIEEPVPENPCVGARIGEKEINFSPSSSTVDLFCKEVFSSEAKLKGIDFKEFTERNFGMSKINSEKLDIPEANQELLQFAIEPSLNSWSLLHNCWRTSLRPFIGLYDDLSKTKSSMAELTDTKRNSLAFDLMEAHKVLSVHNPDLAGKLLKGRDTTSW